MKYTPLPKNRKNGVLSLVLLITSVVVFYLGTQYYTKARAVVQTLGVLCLALASFFILKKLTEYTYSVFPKDSSEKKSVSDYGPDELGARNHPNAAYNEKIGKITAEYLRELL